MKRILSSAALVTLVVLGASCIEEDKSDCRTHADCRGVRQCLDGACVTPEQYASNNFAPRYDDETEEGGDGQVALPLVVEGPTEGFDVGAIVEVEMVEHVGSMERLVLRGERGARLEILRDSKASGLEAGDQLELVSVVEADSRPGTTLIVVRPVSR